MLAFLLLLLSAQAPNPRAPEPAEVRVHVVDLGGRPIEGAIVGSAQKDVLQRTDAEGIAKLTLPVPIEETFGPPAFAWDVQLPIRAKGYTDGVLLLRPFRGARFDRTIRMHLAMASEVRVGHPGVSVFVRWDSPHHDSADVVQGKTDEEGRFAFQYPHSVEWIFVSAAGRSGYRRAAASIEFEIEKPKREEPVERIRLSKRIKGRLLARGGTPVAGWRVSARTDFSFVDGGSSGEQMHFRLTPATTTGADGRFEAEVDGEWLVLCSPIGTTLSYRIAPRSWKEALKEVDLVLPPPAEPMRGRVVDEEGKPLEGVAVHPQGLASGETETDWIFFDWGERATAPVRTDEQGRYLLPLLEGQRPFPTYELEGYVGGHESAAAADTFVLEKKRTLEQDLECRHVIVIARDGGDNPVDGLESYGWVVRSGRQVRATGSVFRDSRGLHLFVPGSESKPWDRIQLALGIRGHVKHSVSLVLPDRPVQRSHIKIPAYVIPPPLKGRLVDPDGVSVPWAAFALFGRGGRSRDRNWLGIGGRTDHQGRFELAHAPDPVGISFWHGEPWRLPGWCDEPYHKRNGSEWIVRLKRGGRIRLRVDARDHAAARLVQATHEESGSSHAFAWHDAHLETAELRPGKYAIQPLVSELDHDVAGLHGIEAFVEVGKTSIVDLRDKKQYPPRPLPREWVTIRCIDADRKPVSGAVVHVWRNSKIESTGLTDRWGEFRFGAKGSRDYQAVVVAPGRGVGARALARGEDLETIALGPSRSVRIIGPRAIERPPKLELERKLSERIVRLHRARGNVFDYVDLPVGARCVLRFENGATARFTIEPGEGAQVLRMQPR